MKNTKDNLFNTPVFLSFQHFAEQINDVNYTGSAGLSNQMKTFYSKALIELASPNLIHDQFAQKRDIPANGGKTVEFRKFLPLSTDIEDVILFENVIPDGQELSSVDIIASIIETGGYVKIGDTFSLTAVDPVLNEANEKISDQAAVIADKITREKMMEGCNVIYANGGETRHKLTLDNTLLLVDILKAAAQLKGANAPKISGDSYVAIIHPYISADLLKEANGFIDITKYKHPEKIFNGELGKLGGVRFVESTQAKIFRGANLGAESRTLTATAASNGKVTVSGAVAGKLVGRYIIIEGELYYVTANTETQLSIVDPDDMVTVPEFSFSGSKTVYPGEGGAEGISVFGTVVVGADAYATTHIAGKGIESIIHGKHEIGGPLDQYSTVGWKLRKTAEILVDEYMVRLESCSSMFPNAPAN